MPRRALAVTLAMASAMLVLGGCANRFGAGAPRTATEVQRKIRMESDSFDLSSRVVGPMFDFAEPGMRGTRFLRTLRKGDAVEHQLYVTVAMTSWAFFERASAKGGREMELVQIDRSVGRGVVSEDVAITLTREDLEAGAAAVRDYKVYGKHRDLVVGLPPYYYVGYLRFLDGEPPPGPAGERTGRMKLGSSGGRDGPLRS